MRALFSIVAIFALVFAVTSVCADNFDTTQQSAYASTIDHCDVETQVPTVDVPMVQLVFVINNDDSVTIKQSVEICSVPYDQISSPPYSSHYTFKRPDQYFYDPTADRYRYWPPDWSS